MVNRLHSENLALNHDSDLKSIAKIENKVGEGPQTGFWEEKLEKKTSTKLEELKKSQQTLYNAIAKEPNIASHYYDLGMIHIQLKEYAIACNHFKKNVALDSQNAHAYANLGRAQYQLGQKAEGETNLEQAVSLEPTDLNFLKDLSKIKFLKAKELKKEALTADPEKQKRLLKKAEHELRTALKLCVKLRYFDELLSLCYKKGSFIDIVEAIKQESELSLQRAKSILISAQEALKNKIQSPVAVNIQAYDLLVLAYVLERQSKIEEAIKFIQQAKNLMPEEPVFFYAESLLWQNSQCKSQSIAALEQAKFLASHYLAK